MKTNLTIIIILFLSSFIHAQEFDEFPQYRLIKYSPTSLLNPISSLIQFSFEHNISETRALQYELGGMYLHERLLSNNTSFAHSISVEHRWYNKFIDFGPNKFQGFGLRFQKQYTQEVEHNINNGLLELTTSFSTVGVYYTRGILRQYDKIFIEFGGRIGVQYVDYSVYNIPDGLDESLFTQNANFLFQLLPAGQFLPLGNLFFKVGFGWKS